LFDGDEPGISRAHRLIKSLFDKLDVDSRQEPVARVFLDEYMPEIVQRTPLTSHGRFDLG
jgi:hypothetical protein